MKKLLLTLGILGGTAFGQPFAAQAQVQVGISVNSGGDSFRLAIGNYYHAPPEQVAVIQQRHIPDEESPVVFFMAAQAHVAPGVIIDLRSGGMGWSAIAARYRLGPKVFYVPARGSFAGTPYEGFYRNYRSASYRMGDAEIVNMVNLKFASDYYHKPASEVIRLRAGGHNFRAIHEQYHPYKKEVRARAHHSAPVRRDVRDRKDKDDRHGDRHDDGRDDRR